VTVPEELVEGSGRSAPYKCGDELLAEFVVDVQRVLEVMVDRRPTGRDRIEPGL
jgi:hypothetical protein